MEYVVEDGNRDAGFIRAFREETGFLRGDYGYEATITIIPSDFGSEVNVTIRDVLIEQGGGRTSDDLGMSQEGLDDLELLRVACV